MNFKKIAAIVCCLAFMAFGAGATLAWLTDTSGPVVNTFTVGAVDITLTETPNTDSDEDSTPDKWTAQVIPGTTYTKDPVVAVAEKTNVDCYLFVKFEEKGNPETYFTYTSTLTTANGWTQGDGTDIPADVWYRVVGKNDTVKSWNLLDGNKIIVKDTVTEQDMANASAAELVYTAYAVQKDNIATAEEAWSKLSN